MIEYVSIDAIFIFETTVRAIYWISTEGNFDMNVYVVSLQKKTLSKAPSGWAINGQ